MLGTDIDRLCRERGLTRAQLIHRMRQAARRTGTQLPGDDSLRRMLRAWGSGNRRLSPLYADLLAEVFGTPFATGEDATRTEAAGELSERLDRAAGLDTTTVDLFETQTETYRLVDRRLGAGHLLVQCQGHVTQMSDLLGYCLPGPVRTGLSRAVAEAAALAGWQALDLGRAQQAWSLHQIARTAALDAQDPSVLAHVTAQQAYALLDLDRPDEARAQIAHARTHAGTRVPGVMRAWLSAAEAEAHAAAGDALRTHRALERAVKDLAAVPADAPPEYLALDETHLARWRGHCLARLGDDRAVPELTDVALRHDGTFARAGAGLHVDLALAHTVRGETEQARAALATARRLADATSSVRQARRIAELEAQSAAAM